MFSPPVPSAATATVMLVALRSFPLNFPLDIFYLIFLQIALLTLSLPGPALPAVVRLLGGIREPGGAALLQGTFLLLLRPGSVRDGVRSDRYYGYSLLRLRLGLLAPAGRNNVFYNSVRSD